MKVTFYLRFSTKFGQNIFICGNHPLLGDGGVSNALPMSFLNNDFWSTEVEFDKSSLNQLNYRYILKNGDGFKVEEWGNDRTLNLNDVPDTLTFVDTWNHAGQFENVFYTSPFKNVLLTRKEVAAPTLSNSNKLVFKVKSPLLKQDEILCLLGNSKETGNWNPLNAVKMEYDGNWWTVGLSYQNITDNFKYKYGIFNTSLQRFIRFEEGLDRTIPEIDSSLGILHDGFARFPNTIWKGAGVAIPVFSLRTQSSFGVGEFNDIKTLADWSKGVGLKMIQLLPVNDTSATNSWQDSYPYAAISAFALHPIFINIPSLEGFKSKLIPDYTSKKALLEKLPVVDYEQVMQLKMSMLRIIFDLNTEAFLKLKDYQNFFQSNKHWLQPYAAFCYLRDLYGTADFNKWDILSVYDFNAVQKMAEKGAKGYDTIHFHYFVQYHLHLQLKEATSYAHEKGLIVKGDIPIGIYRYSVDAWMEPELYHMGLQAGAPPDDFAVHGQNWGFPTYNWERMSQDGYQWWYKRFVQMGHYFDAFRIDHILGFFRIWSIPMSSTQGIMGHFEPSLPVHINEFSRLQISFDYDRFCQPFITEGVIHEMFGEKAELLMPYLKALGNGQFRLVEYLNTQRKVEEHIKSEESDEAIFVSNALQDLLANILLIEVDGSNGHQFHFRFNMNKTSSFKYLDFNIQSKLNQLYIDYFFRRQDDFWKIQAMDKLPALKRSTNMLICGEDLGLVPGCVPDVMQQLGILSLEIQRMPKAMGSEFFNPSDAPYLSVVTPSTHDMSTVRGWWEEDKEKTQRFYNLELGKSGIAPFYCESWICKLIIAQHLNSPAMWSVFQLQDLMGMSEEFRRGDPSDERINVPANSKHYWQYRMHISIEELIGQQPFNQMLFEMIQTSGRN